MKLLAVLLLAFQFAKPVKIADGFDASTAGLAALGEQEIIAWSANGVKVFRRDSRTPIDCGLGGLRDVISIAPGDFNGDGVPDLAILTKFDAELWVNRKGRFEKLNIFLPEGAYRQALWVDYDHNGTLDLFLLGDKSVLLENDGAGFTNLSNNFPFVQGRAVSGWMMGNDLMVLFSDRPGARYVDKGGGRYEASGFSGIAIDAGSSSSGAVLDIGADRYEIRQNGSLVFLRGVRNR